MHEFVESRARDAATMQISCLVQGLDKLASGASAQCEFFVRQLRYVADVVGMQGRGGASRVAVRAIVIHFGNTILPALCKEQQELIRATRGAKISMDNTYKAASSLAGLAHGKLQQFRASLLTVMCEEGLLLAVIMVPNDGQEWECAAVKALHGVPPPADALWHVYVHAMVSFGSVLGKFPRDICTDQATRDAHLWEKVATDVVLECLGRGMEILIPAGAL